ncbi:MAG: hypothetical protein FWC00_02715 [Firmicutes bacterium]|nr:hypothetical protein [Bacillota bacterium]
MIKELLSSGKLVKTRNGFHSTCYFVEGNDDIVVLETAKFNPGNGTVTYDDIKKVKDKTDELLSQDLPVAEILDFSFDDPKFFHRVYKKISGSPILRPWTNKVYDLGENQHEELDALLSAPKGDIKQILKDAEGITSNFVAIDFDPGNILRDKDTGKTHFIDWFIRPPSSYADDEDVYGSEYGKDGIFGPAAAVASGVCTLFHDTYKGHEKTMNEDLRAKYIEVYERFAEFFGPLGEYMIHQSQTSNEGNPFDKNKLSHLLQLHPSFYGDKVPKGFDPKIFDVRNVSIN